MDFLRRFPIEYFFEEPSFPFPSEEEGRFWIKPENLPNWFYRFRVKTRHYKKDFRAKSERYQAESFRYTVDDGYSMEVYCKIGRTSKMEFEVVDLHRIGDDSLRRVFCQVMIRPVEWVGAEIF